MADMGSSSERLSDLRARWEADRRSRIFLQLAEEYRRQGQPLEAMAVLDEGLSLHPSSVAGKVLQGRCRLESGQPEAAAATLEEVVSRDPTHIVAYRWLTEAYLELEDTEQARSRLDIYTQLNPQGEDLSDLSRRLVALEDPARRLSGGSDPAMDATLPPRPSPTITEAPTTITPIPPGLRDLERPAPGPERSSMSEQPTVALPFADFQDEPASGADAPLAPPPVLPSEAPTTAFRLPGPGELPPSEALTAKVRLESLGLVPEAPPAESVLSPPPAPTRSGAETPSPAESPAGFAPWDPVESRGGDEAEPPPTEPPPTEPPPTEQPTAEIPWWRPRPASPAEPSPWDTQEAEARTHDVGVADTSSREDAGSQGPSEAEGSERAAVSASEAPTGILDTAAFLTSTPSPGEGTALDPLSIDEESDTVLPPTAEPIPLEPASAALDENPKLDVLPAVDRGVVFGDTPTADEAAARSSGPAAAAEPFADLFGAPTSSDESAHRPPDVLDLEATGLQETLASEPEPAEANGSMELFRLDASDLLEGFDLSAVPTRPLSIPLWLAPESVGSRREDESVGTPTLARLYQDQGHPHEAEAILDTLPEVVDEPAELESPAGSEAELANAVEANLEAAPPRVEIDAAGLLGDYQPVRGGLTAKQVYVLQRYLARLRGEQGTVDVS